MKLKKTFKRMLKSKKGNLVVLAILLIPIFLTIFSTVVSATRRRNVQRSEVLISIDSFCDYVNNNYGRILKLNGKEVCSFSVVSQEEIRTLWDAYFTNIDGYNSYWHSEISFDVDNVYNTSFVVHCDVYLPHLSNSMQTIDYWGRYNISTKTAIGDGWYSTHSKTMEILCNNWQEKKSNGYWVYEKVEVTSSCI